MRFLAIVGDAPSRPSNDRGEVFGTYINLMDGIAVRGKDNVAIGSEQPDILLGIRRPNRRFKQ
jgi:hypothetical protein